MSALGHKRTFCAAEAMSALPPKADMCGALANVRFVPIADIRHDGALLPVATSTMIVPVMCEYKEQKYL